MIYADDIPNDKEAFDPAYNEEGEGEDDMLLGDTGESLIVRKIFLTPKREDEEDWLRTNIFHTSCAIKGSLQDDHGQRELRERRHLGNSYQIVLVNEEAPTTLQIVMVQESCENVVT